MTADDVRARINDAYETWCRPRMSNIEPDHPQDAFEAGYLAALAAHADRDAEVRELRRLLAVRVAGAMLYTDDGELSDATTAPHIDFRRDSAAEIARKLTERAKFTREPSDG